MNDQPIESKTNNAQIVSIVSYFTFLGWIVAYLLNSPKDPKISFHLRQSLGINLLFIVSGIVFMVPVLGWIAGALGYVFGLLIWILGLIYAIGEDEKEVPIVGQYFQEWFQGV